jgi:hypothetical protein
MFLPDGPKRQVDPPFSLDRKVMIRNQGRRQLSRQEWRFMIFLPVLLVTLGWLMYDFFINLAASRAQNADIPAAAQLAPMGRPDFTALAPLPAADAIAAARADAQALVAAGAHIPLTADGLDAITMAWAEARLEADAAAPPLPQRFSARDLVGSDHIKLGSALIVDARLEDRLPAPVAGSERPWQRLLIELEAGQYAEVISDVRAAAEIPLGSPIRVTGRLLTYHQLAAGQAKQSVPVLLGRVLSIPDPAKPADDILAEFHRPWSMPEGLYDEVDDFRLWTETRPYYYLLGQVLRDRSSPAILADAEDGNQKADDMHLRPADHRGRLYSVVGRVYHAWEDADVARDQPFGVGRVVRVLMWRRDIAPFTETVDGQTTTKVKLVLRLYELAAISDQPLPQRGQLIRTTGRFFKKRAIQVEVDARRDQANQVWRQSDRVYPWLFVTGPWTVEPEQEPTTPDYLAWALTVFCGVGLVIGIWWWRREVRTAGHAMRARVAGIRENRAKLQQKSAPPEASQAAPSRQDPPPT